AVMLMASGQILYVYPVIPLLAVAAGRILALLAAALLDADARGPIGGRPAGALVVLTAVLAIAGWYGSSATFGMRGPPTYAVLRQERYLEMRRLSQPVVVDTIAAAIDRSGRPGGTVFGHPTIASLVALRTGRRVAGDLADLDPRWFLAGSVAREDVVRRIE